MSTRTGILAVLVTLCKKDVPPSCPPKRKAKLVPMIESRSGRYQALSEDSLDQLARFREGEPPGEPSDNTARTEPRPPRITKVHLGERIRPSSAIRALSLRRGLRRCTGSRDQASRVLDDDREIVRESSAATKPGFHLEHGNERLAAIGRGRPAELVGHGSRGPTRLLPALGAHPGGRVGLTIVVRSAFLLRRPRPAQQPGRLRPEPEQFRVLGSLLVGPPDRLVEPGGRLLSRPLAGVRHSQEEPVRCVNALDQLDGLLGSGDRFVPAAAAVFRQRQRVVITAILRLEIDRLVGEGGSLVVIAGRAIGCQGQGPGSRAGPESRRRSRTDSATVRAISSRSRFAVSHSEPVGRHLHGPLRQAQLVCDALIRWGPLVAQESRPEPLVERPLVRPAHLPIEAGLDVVEQGQRPSPFEGRSAVRSWLGSPPKRDSAIRVSIGIKARPPLRLTARSRSWCLAR